MGTNAGTEVTKSVESDPVTPILAPIDEGSDPMEPDMEEEDEPMETQDEETEECWRNSLKKSVNRPSSQEVQDHMNTHIPYC